MMGENPAGDALSAGLCSSGAMAESKCRNGATTDPGVLSGCLAEAGISVPCNTFKIDIGCGAGAKTGTKSEFSIGGGQSDARRL